MFDITIVVPARNRDLLAAAVDSLRRQTYPADRYEILIVSDDRTDGADDLCRESLALPVTRLVRQAKHSKGLSASRNLGIREARGRLVMFLDDDMVADEHLVEVHVAAHRRFGDDVVIRGQVKLAPELPDTPFCRIVLGEVCRKYEENPDEARFTSFYTAAAWQTSCKRDKIVQLGGFDEALHCYGWEDIEFAFRTARAGLSFYYEPRAISYHHNQFQTLAAHGEQLREMSRTVPALFARHPELINNIPMYSDKGPIVWGADGWRLIVKKVARRILATRPVLATLEGLTPIVERMVPWSSLLRRWYHGILGSYVLIGYREGWSAMKGQQRR